MWKVKTFIPCFNSIFGIDDMLIGGALAGVGSIAGSAISAGAANATNAQSIEYSKQRDSWQEQMANTAIYRQQQDLKHAGLNPILAAGPSGGSATPSGGPSPNLQNPIPGNVVGQSLNSALAVADMKKAVDLKQANINNIDQDTENKETQGEILDSQAEKAQYSAKMSKFTVPQIQARTKVDSSWYGQNVKPWIEEIGNRIKDISPFVPKSPSGPDYTEGFNSQTGSHWRTEYQ